MIESVQWILITLFCLVGIFSQNSILSNGFSIITNSLHYSKFLSYKLSFNKHFKTPMLVAHYKFTFVSKKLIMM